VYASFASNVVFLRQSNALIFNPGGKINKQQQPATWVEKGRLRLAGQGTGGLLG
jgi:hypothetical protein